MACLEAVTSKQFLYEAFQLLVSWVQCKTHIIKYLLGGGGDNLMVAA